jgi:gluconolactonase
MCPPGPFALPTRNTQTFVCTDAASQAALRYDVTGGPVWVPSQGAFFFSCYPPDAGAGTPKGDIVKYTDSGCTIVFRDVGTMGLAVAPDGRLVAASFKQRAIVELDLDTGAPTVLVSSFAGKSLATPVDVAVRSNGFLYFTNDNALGPAGSLDSGLYGVGPVGYAGAPLVVASPFTVGQGAIALSPDEKRLVAFGVADVELNGAGGLSSSGAPAGLLGGKGVAAFDCAGNIYISSDMGSLVFAPDGKTELAGFLRVADFAFGGVDGEAIFFLSGKTISVMRDTVPGAP